MDNISGHIFGGQCYNLVTKGSQTIQQNSHVRFIEGERRGQELAGEKARGRRDLPFIKGCSACTQGFTVADDIHCQSP